MQFKQLTFLIPLFLFIVTCSFAELPSDSTQFKLIYPIRNIAPDSVVNYGKLFINTPYRSGGSGSGSFDCSGFTSFVYRNFGYNLQHSSNEQADQIPSVDREHLQAGDLVFFEGRRHNRRIGHVGIVVAAHEDGNFDFIHASSSQGVTISSSLEPYYTKRFLKAGRVIGGDTTARIAQNNHKLTRDEYVSSVPSKTIQKTTPAVYHKVKSGENLTSIAEKYGMTVVDLKEINHLKKNSIQRNQRLIIKNEETYTVAEPDQLATNTNTTGIPSTNLQEYTPGTYSSSPNATHIVKKGETLRTIAKLYHTVTSKLKELNQLTSNKLIPGQELKLTKTVEQPVIAKQESQISVKPEEKAQEKKVEEVTHKVKPGESLFSIAKQYNLTIEELKKANQLTDNKIQPNQELIVSQNATIAQALPEVTTKETKSEIKDVTPESTITHKVKPGESLFSIAKLYDISVDELKKMNNIYANKIIPGQKLNIALKSTAQQSITIEKTNKEEIKTLASEKTVTHKIKAGESLFSIAKLYNISVDELKKTNNLNDSRIIPGKTLNITQKDAVSYTETIKEEKPVRTKHKVALGESLYTIAQQYNISIEELKKANNLSDSKIHPGQMLEIGETDVIQPKDAPKSKPEYHKVKSGESFYSIAKDYKCSIDELKEWNNISGNKLSIGTKLKVYPKKTRN